jgi:hypothetical protein
MPPCPPTPFYAPVSPPPPSVPRSAPPTPPPTPLPPAPPCDPAFLHVHPGQHSFTATVEMQEGKAFVISFFQVSDTVQKDVTLTAGTGRVLLRVVCVCVCMHTVKMNC